MDDQLPAIGHKCRQRTLLRRRKRLSGNLVENDRVELSQARRFDFVERDIREREPFEGVPRLSRDFAVRRQQPRFFALGFRDQGDVAAGLAGRNGCRRETPGKRHRDAGDSDDDEATHTPSLRLRLTQTTGILTRAGWACSHRASGHDAHSEFLQLVAVRFLVAVEVGGLVADRAVLGEWTVACAGLTVNAALRGK